MAMPRWFLCLWFSIRCILYNMYVLFYLPSQLHVFCNTCMFSNRSYLLHAFSVFCMYVLHNMFSVIHVCPVLHALSTCILYLMYILYYIFSVIHACFVLQVSVIHAFSITRVLYEMLSKLHVV